MIYFKEILILVIGLFTGAILFAIRQKLRKRDEEKKKEIEELHKIECEECDIEFLVKEWEVTIQTQMHFNDLIIKFRSIVLSVFIASLGFIYGISEKLDLTEEVRNKFLMFAVVFWLCCFLLDYFYYHQLLIGSVEHSCKFDNNKKFREKGLFGLTKTINLNISPLISTILVWMFYLLPLIFLFIIIQL